MYGIGLRTQHFSHLSQVLETDPKQIKIDWFEGITENFFDTEGRPLQILEKVRHDFPVGLHGVSLFIAAAEPLDLEYLVKVKKLYQRIDPLVVSDHLCWTGHQTQNLHNLLPIPYNDESLNFLIPRIQKVQEVLGRQIALENLSAYFDLKTTTYTEWDFLRNLAQKSGCKILLDINNIYVNSVNLKFDPYVYIDSIPNELVAEVHLAGFTDMGTHLFDTHSCPVLPEVWKLFQHKIKSGLKAPVLVEWDEDVPDYAVVEAEALKAKGFSHG